MQKFSIQSGRVQHIERLCDYNFEARNVKLNKPEDSYANYNKESSSLEISCAGKLISERVCSGSATRGTGCPHTPSTSRRDQFSNSSKFEEKILGLG